MSQASRRVTLLWLLLASGAEAVAQDFRSPESLADEHDPILEQIQTKAWLDYRLSPVDRRLALEEAAADNPFSIRPHRPSYLLPVTFDSHPNREPWQEKRGRELTAENLNEFEAKFQISLKAVLVDKIVTPDRSEEHTSELQSRENLVCRLLFE